MSANTRIAAENAIEGPLLNLVATHRIRAPDLYRDEVGQGIAPLSSLAATCLRFAPDNALDESGHFTDNQKASVASLRSLSGFIPEHRPVSLRNRWSVSSESPAIWDFRYPERDAKPDLIDDGFALLFRISILPRDATQYRKSPVG